MKDHFTGMIIDLSQLIFDLCRVKVADLLPNVRSPKIHSQYGKVMESDQKYKQAAIVSVV